MYGEYAMAEAYTKWYYLKCFDVIVKMYSECKSRIAVNNNFSEYFPCRIGVRQGENLSLFLFALFLNDVESFLMTTNNIGVSTISYEIEHELGILLRLMIILYADDTVLLSETPEDLQNQLNSFLLYCQKWKLEVNVFTKGRMKNNVFYYNGEEVEIVKNFKYLGVIFSSSGSFIQTKTYATERATKAMYGICIFL